MKLKDIRAKKKDALDKDELQLRKELMSLRAQVSMGTTPKSTKQIRSIKKTLARIITIRKEAEMKQLNQEQSIQEVPVAKEDGKKDGEFTKK